MSYLHCPTCACAYNVAREPACPRCGIRAGTPADPTDDIVSAVEQLARAMARATPTELAAAESVLDARTSQLALPAPGAPVAPPPAFLKAVRMAMDPAPAPRTEAPRTTLAHKLLDIMPAHKLLAIMPRELAEKLRALVPAELAERRLASWRVVVDATLARLAPRLPERTAKVIRFERVKSRVRASLRSLLAA